MPLYRYMACLVLMFSVCLLIPASLWSQAGTSGTISGTVSDPRGGYIPGATLTLIDLGTNTVRTMQSGGGGVYAFTDLPPSSYDLTVTMNGFKAVKVQNIKLDVAASRRIDANLALGAVSESVSVEATPPVLNTENASTGQVIGVQEINELPLNGRDFQQLQLLTPGTVSATNYQTNEGLAGGASTLATNQTLNIANGGRAGQALVLVDGANDSDQNSRSIVFRPTIDEIAEFREETANMSAEYGYGSSVVNVSIKSGTNQLHGSVYEFLRNSVTDSRSYFAQSVEPLKRNQFGGTAGGPLIIPKIYDGKDKTFWFVAYEGLRQAQATTEISTVPTALARTGNFSEFSQIYDPLTTVPDPNNPGAFIRSPFPGNIIPPNRINSVASFFLASDWLPLPNLPGNSNNFLIEPSALTTYNQGTFKIDQYFGSSNQVSGRLSQNHELDGNVGPYHGFSLYDPGANPAFPTTYNATVNWVHTFNPNNLLDTRVSYTRAHALTTTPNIGTIDYTTQLGIQGFGPGISNIYPSYPDITINGYTGLPSGALYDYISSNYEYSANYTMVRGRHTFKIGETFRDWQQNLTTSGQGSGSFDFTGMYTQNPMNPASTGSGLADFVLGVPASGGRYIPPGFFYERMKNQWAYFNDSWKATKNLTVTLGVRYEINWPGTEKNLQLASFSPQARGGQGAIVVPNLRSVSAPYYHTSVPLSEPVYGPLSVFASDVGLNPKYLHKVGYHNFAPRIGLAYSLDPNTVLRAGYGLYYLQLDGNVESGLESAPFLIRESGILNDPELPTKTTQTLFPLGSSFSPTASLFGQDPNPTNFGYSQQWNLSFQHAIVPNMSFDLAYVGTAGIHLEIEDGNNTPLPGPGSVQPRRPYPEFGVINWVEQTGQSMYHSLQAKLEGRLAGLTVMGAFTWSKGIDNGSDVTEAYIDPYDHQRSRGVSSFDIPRNFTLSALYALPSLKNETILTRGALGGWMLGGIVSYHDGFPYTPLYSGDPSNTGTSSYADVVPGCNPVLSHPTPQEWFNTACFVAPPGPPIYRRGDAGRNILRGDFYKDYDTAVYKNFHLTDSGRLEIRFEGFNIFNQHSFGFPNATVNSPGYGSVTTASPGRILQFAAKIYF
jgi:Carboxypeptidase regulatory-like domain/TonB dependent receptor